MKGDERNIIGDLKQWPKFHPVDYSSAYGQSFALLMFTYDILLPYFLSLKFTYVIAWSTLSNTGNALPR